MGGPVDDICYDLYFIGSGTTETGGWIEESELGFYVAHGTPGIAIYRWLTGDGTCTLQTLIGTNFAQWGVLLGNGDATPPPVGTPQPIGNPAGFGVGYVPDRGGDLGPRAQAHAAAPAVMQTASHAVRAAVAMRYDAAPLGTTTAKPLLRPRDQFERGRRDLVHARDASLRIRLRESGACRVLVGASRTRAIFAIALRIMSVSV